MDDRRVISGIIYVLRHGLRWKEAPNAYGPHKTLYNRCVRWSRLCVFQRIFDVLANQGPNPQHIMIDTTHVKAHCTAAGVRQKKGGRRVGRTAGGLHSRLHAVCDGNGCPVRIALTEGQRSDDDGSRVLLADLSVAQQLLADKGIRCRLVRCYVSKTQNQRVYPGRGQMQSSGNTRCPVA